MEVSSVLQEGEGLMGCSLAKGAMQNISSEDTIQQVSVWLMLFRRLNPGKRGYVF